MRSTTAQKSSPRLALFAAALAACAAGCSHLENHWVEDGPATRESLETPTTREVAAAAKAPVIREREWDQAVLAMEDAGVTHFPLYFEDPFVDKGHGREGLNVYYIGWEDYVAMPYSFARHTVNWMFLPVSAIVTPPWRVMESDGEISEQALGPDHDATRASPDATEQPRPLDPTVPSVEPASE